MALFKRRTRQLATLLLSLVVPGGARAQAADVSAGRLDPGLCSREQVPYFRDSRAEPVKQLTPQGLYFKQGTARHLLFATSFGTPQRAAVLKRDGGKAVASAAAQDVAIVEDEAGKLLGLLLLGERSGGKRQLQLQTPQGEARWKVQPVIAGFGDSASVVVAGDLLIVAHFHRIATGSSLTALELATGAIKWQADVQQLQVAHSKYWNDVELTRAGNILTLHGVEAAGCYVQTFDLMTGRRLSAKLQKPL
jgi:hypothetical protein